MLVLGPPRWLALTDQRTSIFFSFLPVREKRVASPFLLSENWAQREILIHFGNISEKNKASCFYFFFQTWSSACSLACGAVPVLLEQGRGAFWRDDIVKYSQGSGRATPLDSNAWSHFPIFSYPHFNQSWGNIYRSREGERKFMWNPAPNHLLCLSYP